MRRGIHGATGIHAGPAPGARGPGLIWPERRHGSASSRVASSNHFRKVLATAVAFLIRVLVIDLRIWPLQQALIANSFVQLRRTVPGTP